MTDSPALIEFRRKIAPHVRSLNITLWCLATVAAVAISLAYVSAWWNGTDLDGNPV
jgi:hypothetical protein